MVRPDRAIPQGGAGVAADQAEADATRSYPLVRAIGRSGLRASSGYVREEFLTELTGRKGRQMYAEMASNDSTVGAVLYAITMLLRSVGWRWQPSDPEDDQAVEYAEMVQQMLTSDMQHSWPEVIDQICSMFPYGFAVMEVLWKQRKGANAAKPWLGSEADDGLYAPRALALRSQRSIDRWVFDEEENLLGFEQQPDLGPAIIVPIQRCLHFRTTVGLDNPEGRSVIRSAYKSYYFLKRLQEIEGIGVERDLAGLPVMSVPAEILNGTAPKEMAARTAYEDLVQRIRRDSQEGIVLPSDCDEKGNRLYDLKLLTTGGSRAIGIGQAIERYQRDIARSVLAEFIFLGADGGGSLALGKTKVETFTLAMEAYLSAIAAVINEDLIPKIWALNGLDVELMPKAEPESVSEVDLEGLGKFVQVLSTVGFPIAGDRELEAVLRQKAELPPAPENAEDYADWARPDAMQQQMLGEDDPEAAAGSSTDDGGDSGSEGERQEEQDVKATRKGFFAGVLEGFDGRG